MFIKRTHENGFSLVESVVASVVFMIAVVSVATTLKIVEKTKTQHIELNKALFGQSVLEKLHAAVDQRTWNQGSNPLTAGTSTYLSADGYYEATVVIADNPDGYANNADLREVTVTVNYIGP